MSNLDISKSRTRYSNNQFMASISYIYRCLLFRFEGVHRTFWHRNTRASPTNQETVEGRRIRLGRAVVRNAWFMIVQDEPASRNASVRVSGRKRTKRTRRPGRRDRETKLGRHRGREHRNAGRIALSPADRRSISYEYRCPWRYTTSEPRGVLPKICTGHPHTRIGASPLAHEGPSITGRNVARALDRPGTSDCLVMRQRVRFEKLQ